jgi:DNA-binding PadR family transcriptional regulator
MATRRKVGNLLALAVLTVLIERPMHPYEMASVLRERGKDQDMQIKWGSLYTVVRNLEKHGLIEAAASQRHGGRPERTVYRVTPAGHAEALDWIRELISTPEREHTRFEAGLSVVGLIGPDEAIRLLTERLERLLAQIADERANLARVSAEVPRLFLVEAEFGLAIRDAEVTWLRSILDELYTGALPGIDQWRAWHESGQVPEELAGLVERGATDKTGR